MDLKGTVNIPAESPASAHHRLALRQEEPSVGGIQRGQAEPTGQETQARHSEVLSTFTPCVFLVEITGYLNAVWVVTFGDVFKASLKESIHRRMYWFLPGARL